MAVMVVAVVVVLVEILVTGTDVAVVVVDEVVMKMAGTHQTRSLMTAFHLTSGQL